ncbi:MAG: TonB-dependent receptor [Draconibacterium sp.]|nr:TonB-dependent receptor [Draconibacterium sp.]
MISKYMLKNIYIFILGFLLPSLCIAQEEVKDTVVVSNNKQQLVNIGYGIQPKWMVSGAVSSVDGDRLEKSFTSNLSNTLSGNLNGLTVFGGGGEPGLQSPTMRIRGVNTFGSGRDVLILVDGYEIPIGQIDPEEVESVVALKDAAATSIYGSKGANGVLLITTKRGKEGAFKINLNVQHGYSSPINLPEYFGSYDYATLYNEALVNDGKTEIYNSTDLEAYRSGNQPYLYPNVNWYDEVLRDAAPLTKYNLSFSGGDQTVKYYVVLGIINEQGLYKKTEGLSDFSINTNYQRFNYRTNVDINLSKRLSAHLTLGGTIANKSNPADNSTSNIFNSMSLIAPNAFPVYNPNESYGGSSLYSNPYGDILELGKYTSNERVFQGIFKLSQQLDMITPGLSISGEIALNTTFKGISNKVRTYSRYGYSINELGEEVYTKIGEDTSLEPIEKQFNQFQSTAIRAFLDYSRSFGDNSVNGLLMFNTSNYTPRVGDLPYYDRGVFGRFTYVSNKKYIGEFSFGYNASDNFPSGKRWGFFPAISAGWIVSNENFLKDHSTVNFLKLRGSYGLVGNDNIGGKRFMFFEDWGGVGRYYFGTGNKSTGSYGEEATPNEDVTWEKQKQFNIGLDATLWNKIELSFDIFKQHRYDILAKPYNEVPAFLGLTLPDLNVGKVENKGVESMIRFNSDAAKPFQYYAQLNVWYAKSKIIDNSEVAKLNEYLYRSGHPVNQPFVFEAIGLFEDESDIVTSPTQIFTDVQPGDVKYKDQNNDGVIDDSDLYPIGHSNIPELTAGLSSGFSYKGFDFDVMFQGVTNRTSYLSGSYYEAFQNNGKVSKIALNRWTEATKEGATYPRLSAENNINNYQRSTFWQRNGSYIKLRSIELGYSLPENLINKLGLNNARIYLNGTNLFTLDKLKKEERVSSGYPSVRTYSLGVKFQF